MTLFSEIEGGLKNFIEKIFDEKIKEERLTTQDDLIRITEEFKNDIIADTESKIEEMIDEKMIDEYEIERTIEDKIEEYGIESMIDDKIDSSLEDKINAEGFIIEDDAKDILKNILDESLNNYKVKPQEIEDLVNQMSPIMESLISKHVKKHFKLLSELLLDRLDSENITNEKE